MTRFEAYHPAVLLFYFLSVLMVTMFTANPAVLVISLSGAVAYFLAVDLRRTFFRDLWFYLILWILIAFTNPLFSHNGVTPLFFLNGQAVTKESLLFGATIATMLAAVLYWFKCFHYVMTSEKLLFLLGRVTPKIALVISSALRFIPLYTEEARRMRAIQKTMGLYSTDSLLDRLKGTLRMLSALLTWSLEHAVETGSAMRARGYRLKGRRHFSIFRFRRSDLFFGILILTADVIFLVIRSFGKMEFSFYPRIVSVSPDMYGVLGYVAFLMVAYFPFILEIKEMIQWNYYRSKI